MHFTSLLAGYDAYYISKKFKMLLFTLSSWLIWGPNEPQIYLVYVQWYIILYYMIVLVHITEEMLPKFQQIIYSIYLSR